MKLHINNGQLLDAENSLSADLFIAEGKIIATDTKPDGFEAERIIDASGKLVIPGITDLRARVREPGDEHIATIKSECYAAAANGITALCLPPDTNPVINRVTTVDMIMHKAAASAYADVLPVGALTNDLAGEQLNEIGILKEAGCIGFGNADVAIRNNAVLRRAMEYASNFDTTLFFLSLDQDLSKNGLAHEGAISTRLGLKGIPYAAETIELARLLALVEETGARCHFHCLTSSKAVDLIRDAKNKGLPVTADVSIHHLWLTHMDLHTFDSQCKFIPPLREESDMQSLRQGLIDGTIDAIVSDHQPHNSDNKLAPFPTAAAGSSSLDVLLSLAFKLANETAMEQQCIVRALTHAPARIAGRQGALLTTNSTATLSIVNTETEALIDGESFISNGKNTAYQGWMRNAEVETTIKNGEIIYQQ